MKSRVRVEKERKEQRIRGANRDGGWVMLAELGVMDGEGKQQRGW